MLSEGRHYALQSKTIHNAGLSSAFDESIRVLWKNSTDPHEVLHPCLQSGYRKDYNVTGLQPDNPDASEGVTLVGNVNLMECQNLVQKVSFTIFGGYYLSINTLYTGHISFHFGFAYVRQSWHISEPVSSILVVGTDKKRSSLLQQVVHLDECGLFCGGQENSHEPSKRVAALNGFYVVWSFFGLDDTSTVSDLRRVGDEFCKKEWSSIEESLGDVVHVDNYCFR